MLKLMARMIVGRLHVSASNREVLRYARSRLTNPRQASMEDKKEYYRICLKEHNENRALYNEVMG